MNSKKYNFLGFLLIVFQIGVVTLTKSSIGSEGAIQMESHKTKGNLDAKNYLVVFSDFACPYCNKIRPILDKVLDTFPNDLKIVFKHYPLQMHPPAPLAAQASECAADQEKFWDYHDVLFREASNWYLYKNPTNYFLSYASELELNMKKFEQCLESGEKSKIVEQNMQEGDSFRISGTPTVILNGQKVMTRYKYDYLVKEIRKYL